MARLDELEKFARDAEEKNEFREKTQEEKCMDDLVFPDQLRFPISKTFRLWLSVIPVANFPSNFARRCFKITLELPTAIRPNAMKSLGSI